MPPECFAIVFVYTQLETNCFMRRVSISLVLYSNSLIPPTPTPSRLDRIQCEKVQVLCDNDEGRVMRMEEDEMLLYPLVYHCLSR